MSWKQYTVSALGAAFLFLILGIVFLPFLFLIPFTLLSIVVYPVVRELMPGLTKQR